MSNYPEGPSSPRPIETLEGAADRLRDIIGRFDNIIGFVGNVEYALQGLRSDQCLKESPSSAVKPVEGQLSTIHSLIADLESRTQLLGLMASNAAARIG